MHNAMYYFKFERKCQSKIYIFSERYTDFSSIQETMIMSLYIKTNLSFKNVEIYCNLEEFDLIQIIHLVEIKIKIFFFLKKRVESGCKRLWTQAKLLFEPEA